MIIGNGLIGSAFSENKEKYNDCVIFASGVSDSLNSDNNNFDREESLILKTLKENKNSKFIYFSSILVDIIDNQYYNHKKKIEGLIKKESKNYIIFRIPQIIGKFGNKSNLFNFLKNQILKNEEIIIYNNVYRALIDVDDLIKIVDYIKDNFNCETILLSNIEKKTVLEIVSIISENLKVDARIKILNTNTINNWTSNNDILIDKVISKIGIERINYTKNIIKKYINN